MPSYFKAAFLADAKLPIIGRVPANALALLGAGFLGFAHPGFWVAGAGAEVIYLIAVAYNPSFRRKLDSAAQQLTETEAEAQRHTFIDKLTWSGRERVAKLEEKCQQILTIHAESQTEDFMIESDREALKQLAWLHLKLLIAQKNLTALGQAVTGVQLQNQIVAAQKNLEDPSLSYSLRESREATLRILQQRQANQETREHALKEIASDLLRIEAQIALAVENAGIRGRTESISIRLVSQLLVDNALYGDSGASIAALERTYGASL